MSGHRIVHHRQIDFDMAAYQAGSPCLSNFAMSFVSLSHQAADQDPTPSPTDTTLVDTDMPLLVEIADRHLIVALAATVAVAHPTVVARPMLANSFVGTDYPDPPCPRQALEYFQWLALAASCRAPQDLALRFATPVSLRTRFDSQDYQAAAPQPDTLASVAFVARYIGSARSDNC